MERMLAREWLLTQEVDLEIKVVNYLFNADRFVSTAELSSVLNEETKKITKIVQKLEDHVKDHGDKNIQLLRVKRGGVHLVLPSETDMKTLLSHLLLTSPLIALLDELFSNTFISVINYSQNNYISEATVRRYIRKIRTYLGQYNIDIARRDFSIEGSEKQIRIFMLLFYWRINQGVGWPFRNISEHRVERIVDYLCDEKKGLSKVSRIERRRMMFYIAITLIRTREKKYIKIIRDWEMERNSYFDKFFEAFSELKKDIFLSEDEILFHYEIWKIFLWTSDMAGIIEQEQEKQSGVAISVNATLRLFQEYFFTLNPSFIKQIEPYLYATHMSASLFENLLTDLNGYQYLRKIELYYPELKKRISNLIDILYKTTNNKIFLEESYLIIYYWAIFSHFNKAAMYEKKTNLLLETDLPKSLRETLRQMVEGHFNFKYNINVYTSDMNYNENEMDIILSTNTLDGLDKEYPNAKIIAINREIRNRDLRRIERELLNNLE